MENKRYEFRMPVQIIVDHLQAAVDESPAAQKGYIREVSASGCRFESNLHLKPGQELTLSFVLISGYTVINARVRVIRQIREKHGLRVVACQFVNLSEVDEYKIREFIIWKEAHRENQI